MVGGLTSSETNLEKGAREREGKKKAKARQLLLSHRDI